MANTFSALKRMRQTESRTAVNRARKSRLRGQLRTLRRIIAQNDTEGAEKLLPATFSIVDRSAKWGIIKKNTAARYKSRIVARLRLMTAA
jgi:small subunit ribosomal protein S20